MPTYDVLVAGGGIAGASVAREAVLRGLSVVLVEKGDIASGTSSRSTKLLHGGLRYLEHGHVRLVREALREREITARLAPHLARPLRFVVPARRGARPGRLTARIGVALYDLLSGRTPLGRGRGLSAEDVARALTVADGAWTGGVEFFDRQTDDVRLTLAIARDAARRGAAVLTGHEVVGWIQSAGGVAGALCRVVETGKDVEIRARVAVNAGGPWADRLRSLAGLEEPTLRPTRGAHLVLPDLGLRSAVLFAGSLPGHRLFAIPWRGATLFGTTDTDDAGDPDAVTVHPGDVVSLLDEARRIFPRASLGRGDVRSTFAGLRPLLRAEGNPLALSREHRVIVERGLVTLVGGKLTTWRVMGVDAANAAAAALGRPRSFPAASWSEPLPGGGPARGPADPALASVYGSEAADVAAIAADDPSAAEALAPGETAIVAQVDFAVGREFARTVADVVLRRLPLGHDPARARAAVPAVAARMRRVCGWSAEREAEEVRGAERAIVEAAGGPRQP